jgi:hypothetical protein
LLFIFVWSGQGIGRGIVLPLYIDNAEIVVLQFFVPPCGPSGEFSRRLPVGEVLVVGLNHEGFFSPDQVWSLVLD